jgi:cell wall-associated NlpC family hydrolase
VATRTRSLLRAFAAAAAVSCVVGVVPGTASADPSRATVEARKELARINVQVEVAAEHYNAAQIALEAARRASARATARVSAKETALRTAQRGLGDLVAAAYRSGGGADPLVQLMTTATPGTFLNRAATLDAVARSRNDQMRAIRVARLALKHERDLAAEQVARTNAIATDMARTKAGIEKALVRQKALVARLESADARRERLAREAAARRAAQLAAARARAAALQRAAALARASRSRSASTAMYNGPASGRASTAVAEAYRQLGKPYEWGAAGPDTFDCSGLTMWAWAKAGVSLPHHSGSQYNQGTHVSQSELRPGDLVFFGSPIHHVGIYVGNGNMINAPETGDVVKVAPAFRSDYVGATRL